MATNAVGMVGASVFDYTGIWKAMGSTVSRDLIHPPMNVFHAAACSLGDRLELGGLFCRTQDSETAAPTARATAEATLPSVAAAKAKILTWKVASQESALGAMEDRYTALQADSAVEAVGLRAKIAKLLSALRLFESS
eukprot:TRINITY_DN8486_c1_g1_i1.p3 TRINITY_DN8486_c1_g1~~TRINITY_DN8486_c1_g1_i1.p3  ORF type:complete len:138 (+),score=39.79 TRINITY_DN8486_c1_g1_i1:946-1359(+)